MGLVSYFVKFLSFIVIFLLVIAFVPGIPPHLNFTSYKLDPKHPLVGPLAKNDILDKAERLYEGHLIAPESIAIKSDSELYVTLQNGEIAKIWGNDFDHTEVLTKIPRKCDANGICGRPLGIRLRKDGKLIVADCGRGILLVDPESGSQELLVDSSLPIDGIKPMIPDDLDVDSSGNIYWSDASTHVPIEHGAVAIGADPSGRLIKYDPKTKKNTVLLRNIHFANGVQLTPDESAVLFTETFRRRVRKYWLKGPKKGSEDVFVRGLPGMPDNIRLRQEGGYYIPLASVDSFGGSSIDEWTAPYGFLRRLVTRLYVITKNTADLITTLVPNEFTKAVGNKVLSLGSVAETWNGNRSGVVEVSESGEIIGAMFGDSGMVRMISQASRIGDCLYFCSYANPYLGRLCGVDKIKYKSLLKDPTSKDEL